MGGKKPLVLYDGRQKELLAGDTIAVPVAQLAGSVLSFTQDAFYGTIAEPTTGDVSGIIDGALLGVTVMVIHNDSVAPAFEGIFKKLTGSDPYVINNVNYIFCQYISDSHINYFIKQVQ